MPHISLRALLAICLAIAAASAAMAQAPARERLAFLQPADSLHRGRLWTSIGTGTAVYAGFSIALYNTWYRQYELTSLHSFDDSREWLQMDKGGHILTAYLESRIAFQGARWVGIRERPAIAVGVGVGTLLQTTLELMDGFSAEWGFSWSDVAANTVGVGVMASQQYLWHEQRITMKASTSLAPRSRQAITSIDGLVTTTLEQRATELYGNNFAEVFLKDYNNMTIWASVNPASFFPDSRALQRVGWLNIALGHGAENLYGGTQNRWTDDQGHQFYLFAQDFPRYRQFFLSLDIDLTRIPVKNRFLRSLFHAIHWIKIPAPTLEVTSLGRVRLHPIYW